MAKKLIICIVVIMIQSCSTTKDIIYLQDANPNTQSQVAYYNANIQPNDILKVTISTLIPEAAAPYNKQMSVSRAVQY